MKKYLINYALINMGFTLIVYLILENLQISFINNSLTGFLFSLITSILVSTSCFLFLLIHQKKIKENILKESKSVFQDLNADKFLKEHFKLYRTLSLKERNTFLNRLRLFAAEKKISGVEVDITPEIKLMVALSALYPVMKIPEWRFSTLNEIIIYPTGYNEDYDFNSDKSQGFVAGTSFTGANTIILSLKDLKHGFANNFDGNNVGIHEIMHKIDEEDGRVDGIPEILADQKLLSEWRELADEKIELIKKGKIRDINSYGATNRAEFFAVICEYFFEKPYILKRKHPRIFKMLTTMFKHEINEGSYHERA